MLGLKPFVQVIGCLSLVLWSTDARTQTPPTTTAFHVLHYDVQVEPDLLSKSISGEVTIRLVTLSDGIDTIAFDCGDLAIDSVREGNTALFFVRRMDARVVVSLRGAAKAHETHAITIAYHGMPQHGISFFAAEDQVYTAFATSQWMVCRDAPDEKASIDLSVVVPASWAVVANGREVGTRTLPNHRVLHQFSQDMPVSTYAFGFAAGRFDEGADKVGRVQLRYLTSGMPKVDAQRVFGDTPDMVTFFESKAGMKYPGAIYTQVLAAGTVQQEMSGFSALGDFYGKWVIDHPKDVALGAHELAHQWWGNGVTCASWNEFWLNEGIATFMAAAFIEHRFGRDEYLRLIGEYRASYETVRAAGHDKPLVFTAWVHPTTDDRTVVYRKGAYVLHLLRDRLGEDVFWKGIRLYTQQNFGKSVITGDLQAAFERASGAPLSDFFQEWIY